MKIVKMGNENQGGNNPPSRPQNKNKKIIIIAAIIILVFAVVVGGGIFYFNHSKSKANEVSTEKEIETYTGVTKTQTDKNIDKFYVNKETAPSQQQPESNSANTPPGRGNGNGTQSHSHSSSGSSNNNYNNNVDNNSSPNYGNHGSEDNSSDSGPSVTPPDLPEQPNNVEQFRTETIKQINELLARGYNNYIEFSGMDEDAKEFLSIVINLMENNPLYRTWFYERTPNQGLTSIGEIYSSNWLPLARDMVYTQNYQIKDIGVTEQGDILFVINGKTYCAILDTYTNKLFMVTDYTGGK